MPFSDELCQLGLNHQPRWRKYYANHHSNYRPCPIDQVWSGWTTPEDITQWNFASDDWQCPRAEMDLRAGGTFNSRMEAKDGSMGFDFEGIFTDVQEHRLIEYVMEDGRKVKVLFEETDDGVQVSETFDAEDQHSAEQQREGWQSILDNFKKHVEMKNN